MEYVIKTVAWALAFAVFLRFSHKGLQLPPTRPRLVAWGLAAFYAAGYFYWIMARHGSFETFAGDVTVYLQALSNWRLESPILGGTLLSRHFSPILYIFVPLFSLWPSVLPLYVLQALWPALAAIPLYRLARRFGATDWSAVLIVWVYLNCFYTRQVAFADFHAESLAPFLLLGLFVLFMERRSWIYWVAFALCLTIKEDIGFYLMAWGLVMALAYPELRNRALISAGLGFVAGVASLTFLLPGYGGVYPPFQNWSAFGHGLFGIVLGALNLPFLALAAFFKPAFAQLVLMLGALPLLSWWALAFLPVVWVQLSSQDPVQSSLLWYYAAPVLPLVFAAMAAGWCTLVRRLEEAPARRAILAGLALFLVIFNLPWSRPPRVSAEERALSAVLQTLPARARVLAQADAAPHIRHPERIRVLGLNDFPAPPEFVVFHLKGSTWPFSRAAYLKALQTLRRDPRYTIWKEAHGALIFKRRQGPPA